MTPPKKGLKTRPYSMDMNKENNVATLPKKGLKKYDCNIYMDMNISCHLWHGSRVVILKIEKSQ